jgi:hypothetical protein
MTVEEEHERWMYVRRLEGALRTALGLLEIREKTEASVECMKEWRELLQRAPR